MSRKDSDLHFSSQEETSLIVNSSGANRRGTIYLCFYHNAPFLKWGYPLHIHLCGFKHLNLTIYKLLRTFRTFEKRHQNQKTFSQMQSLLLLAVPWRLTAIYLFREFKKLIFEHDLIFCSLLCYIFGRVLCKNVNFCYTVFGCTIEYSGIIYKILSSIRDFFFKLGKPS